MFHGGLNLGQAIESFAAANGIGIGGWAEKRVSGRAQVSGALRLNAVELDVQVTNLGAEEILLGDASFKSIDIERDDVGTSSGERAGKRAEKREALFEEFE